MLIDNRKVINALCAKGTDLGLAVALIYDQDSRVLDELGFDELKTVYCKAGKWMPLKKAVFNKMLGAIRNFDQARGLHAMIPKENKEASLAVRIRMAQFAKGFDQKWMVYEISKDEAFPLQEAILLGRALSEIQTYREAEHIYYRDKKSKIGIHALSKMAQFANGYNELLWTYMEVDAESDLENSLYERIIPFICRPVLAYITYLRINQKNSRLKVYCLERMAEFIGIPFDQFLFKISERGEPLEKEIRDKIISSIDRFDDVRRIFSETHDQDLNLASLRKLAELAKTEEELLIALSFTFEESDTMDILIEKAISLMTNFDQAFYVYRESKFRVRMQKISFGKMTEFAKSFDDYLKIYMASNSSWQEEAKRLSFQKMQEFIHEGTI